MRRADRLFQIVQYLRRERAVTAASLARELEVSERTIYRDVQDLVLSGVPIQGEAGVGYALPASFDLPPLMFDREEVQALVLGARMVESWSDERLARAARSALAKVEHVLPAKLAAQSAKNRLYAPGFFVPKESLAAMTTIRGALDEQRVLRLEYRDEHSRASRREVRPLALSFWGRTWTLTAWCELRRDFRSFRLDRIGATTALARRFEDEPGRTFEDYLARLASEEPPPADRAPTNPTPRAVKPPKLALSAAERRAFARAKVRVAELAALSADELAARTGGAIELARCAELVALAGFQRLGSIGLESARDLVLLGFRRVDDLVGGDPRELFTRLCKLTHSNQDPCVEDVLRCAIAQAEHPDLPPPWREWHRWTPLRGKPPGTLPTELADARGRVSAASRRR
ncbi:MAG: WYL domain-containing protein [Planctomycetes bacterium]|nr:WYL domain-containing protein [Planctomycetota bacterium]